MSCEIYSVFMVFINLRNRRCTTRRKSSNAIYVLNISGIYPNRSPSEIGGKMQFPREEAKNGEFFSQNTNEIQFFNFLIGLFLTVHFTS